MQKTNGVTAFQKGGKLKMRTFDIMQTIFNFFAMLYIHRFMCSFFDHTKKKKSKWWLCLYLIYPILTSALYFAVNYPILNLISNIVSLFLITFQYHAEMGQRIVATGLTYFCMAIIETACTVVTDYIGVSIFHTGTYQNIAGLITVNLFIFMASLIVCHLKNMRKAVPISRSLWIAIAVIPISSIIVILIVLQNDFLEQTQAIVIVVVFLIINSCTFFLYDALVASYNVKLQTALLAEEKECYYNQCQYMLQSEQEFLSFRHDIQNQLDMIYEFLRQESSDKILQCTSKIESKLIQNDIFSKTNNITLDSILNLKLTQAKRKGIEIKCSTSVPEDLHLDASDLMVVFGNLLDNAITASEQVKVNPFITVEVSYEKGMLFISIENSFQGKLIETDGQLFTTKKNKEQHGYGIDNVKRILEQYHGMIEFHHTESVFWVEIALYCTPSEH